MALLIYAAPGNFNYPAGPRDIEKLLGRDMDAGRRVEQRVRSGRKNRESPVDEGDPAGGLELQPIERLHGQRPPRIYPYRRGSSCAAVWGRTGREKDVKRREDRGGGAGCRAWRHGPGDQDHARDGGRDRSSGGPERWTDSDPPTSCRVRRGARQHHDEHGRRDDSTDHGDRCEGDGEAESGGPRRGHGSIVRICSISSSNDLQRVPNNSSNAAATANSTAAGSPSVHRMRVAAERQRASEADWAAIRWRASPSDMPRPVRRASWTAGSQVTSQTSSHQPTWPASTSLIASMTIAAGRPASAARLASCSTRAPARGTIAPSSARRPGA